MGSIEVLIIWVGLALVVGYAATQKGRSFGLYALLSLLLSPLIALIILVVSGNAQQVVAPAPASAVGVASELEKLTQLRDQGHITDEEFARQRAILLPPATPWGPAAQAGPGMLCGRCGKPLSPVWRGKCGHCGAMYAEFTPVARA